MEKGTEEVAEPLDLANGVPFAYGACLTQHPRNTLSQGTTGPKEVSEEEGMTDHDSGTTRKGKPPRTATLVLLALTTMVAIVFTVGWFWFGWQDIAQNRLILRSLPVPPGAERNNVDSYGYSRDDSFITPPGSWSTWRSTTSTTTTRNTWLNSISRGCLANGSTAFGTWSRDCGS